MPYNERKSFVQSPFIPAEDTDVYDEDLDIGARTSQIKVLDVHALFRLNHFELAVQRLSLLERVSSMVSLRTTEVATRVSVFKRPLRQQQFEPTEQFDDDANLVPDESEEG